MLQVNQLTDTDHLTKEVLKPLLYADIFDFPLTFDEIYQFLEFKASQDIVQDHLDRAVTNGEILFIDGHYCLNGKPHLVEIREQRYVAAQELWPKALYYGHWIASLPFVRMVSVTGSLAVDNPRDSIDDIDYFIITSPNRLWLCRALIILMVRYGHRQGVHLCPNYLLTENIMIFKDTNLYTARELMQMVPIYGKAHYLDIRAKNPWVTDYLPQGDTLNLDRVTDALSLLQRVSKRISEFLLGGFLGNLLEKILQRKQIAKHLNLAKRYGALDKVIFTEDACKGHYDGHSTKTLSAYRQRLDQHRVTQQNRHN